MKRKKTYNYTRTTGCTFTRDLGDQNTHQYNQEEEFHDIEIFSYRFYFLQLSLHVGTEKISLLIHNPRTVEVMMTAFERGR